MSVVSKRPRALGSLLALCLAFGLALEATPSQPPAAPPALVRLEGALALAPGRAAALGPVRASGADFRVVSTSSAAARRARDRGMTVWHVGDGRIRLGAYHFDPSGAPPALPAGLGAPALQAGRPTEYLFQFFGPPRREWLEALRDTGVEPLAYVPSDSWLVRGTPEALQAAAGRVPLRASTPFAAAYKFAPGLWPLLRRAPVIREPVQVVVGLARAGGRQASLAAVARAGAEVWAVDDADPDFLLAQVRVLPLHLPALARQGEVLFIDGIGRPQLRDEVSAQIMTGEFNAGGVPTPGYNAWLAGWGLDGAGVTVGVVDNGIAATEEHLVGRVALAEGTADGADGHGHHVAGIIAGQCDHFDGNGYRWAQGVAPGASLISVPLLRSTGGAPPITLEGLRQSQQWVAEQTGTNGERGTIVNNSWGFSHGHIGGGADCSAEYGVLERMFDQLVQDGSSDPGEIHPLFIIFAAANDGPDLETLGCPDGAKNIVTVGVSENYRPGRSANLPSGEVKADDINALAPFSGRGPTGDGRLKPDLVAPGTWIASARSGPEALWGNIDARHRWSSGSSMAAPHVAGAAALLTQWWRQRHNENPSPAMLKALLVHGAAPMPTVGEPLPNPHAGWGRVSLRDSLADQNVSFTVDEEIVLTPASPAWNISGSVADSGQPLTATLVWTDPAGFPNTDIALINDLDLEIEVNGQRYTAVRSGEGVSPVEGPADRVNNVERVIVPNAFGPFTVHVTAASLAGDGVPGGGELDQAFALVLGNAVLGEGNLRTLSPGSGDTLMIGQTTQFAWTGEAAGSLALDLSRDGGVTWQRLASGLPNTGSFEWEVAPPATGQAVWRIVPQAEPNNFARNPGVFEIIVPPSPAAPLNLTATPLSPSQVMLAWNEGGPFAASYELQRRIGKRKWEPLATVDAAATQFFDPGAQPDSRHRYRVRAVNFTGSSSWEGPAATRTPGLAQPVNLTANALSPTEIALSWQPGDAFHTGFELQRRVGRQSWQTRATLSAGARDFLDANLQPDQRYRYRIRALSGIGNSRWEGPVNLRTPGLAPPRNFTAAAVSPVEVALSWQPGDAFHDGFEIQRRVGTNRWQPLVTLPANATGYADTGLRPDQRYRYRIRAVGGIGNSPWVGPEGLRTPPLAVPQNVSAAALSSTQIFLQWEAGDEHHSGFQIQRRVGGNRWQLLMTVGAAVRNLLDGGLQPDRRYRYRLRAIAAEGQSAWSEIADLHTPADGGDGGGGGDLPPPPPPSSIGLSERLAGLPTAAAQFRRMFGPLPAPPVRSVSGAALSAWPAWEQLRLPDA